MAASGTYWSMSAQTVQVATEGQRGQLFEAAEADVATPAMSRDGVGAGIDTEIPHAGTQTTDLASPRSLACTHVEHRAQLSLEQVFRDPDYHAYLATDGVRGMDPGARIAVPSVEVGFVVGLTAGGRRHRRGKHANRA